MMVRLTIGFLLSIAAATAAQAIPQDQEPHDLDPPPAAASFAVGPAYIFGTHNTKMTVLILDPAGSRLCSPDLTNCRPAYGVDALFRSQQLQVTQLLKWDRSGIFALNASEMIACFNYFDSPGGAYFSCQTAGRPVTTSNYMLSSAITALAMTAYSGAGLQPQSASRANALYQKRKSTTAYAKAYGTLPPERMKALSTEDDPVPYMPPSSDPPPPDIITEMVEITGNKSPETAPPPAAPPGLIFMSNVTITPPTAGRTPAIVVDGCVTFQVCSEPPPPPPPYLPPPPPRICQPQCQAAHAAMSASCAGFTAGIAGTVAIVVPVGSIVATIVGTPAMGAVFFKTGGLAGGTVVAAWAGACTALNSASLNQCVNRAKQKGC